MIEALSNPRPRHHHGLNHELIIPHHESFAPLTGDVAATPWLIVSGPSRMGNHLLLSLLDGHPSLPAVPGEDGLLSFAVSRAAKNPDAFFDRLASEADSRELRLLAANGHFDKWQRYDKLWQAGRHNDKPAGLATTEVPAVFDYRGPAPRIDFQTFRTALDQVYPDIAARRSLAFLVLRYVQCLKQLLASNTGKTEFRFDGIICHSGMRAQALWVLSVFSKVVLLASLRPFASYVVSHHRSRYPDKPMSDDIFDEAWSHWQSKIADYITMAETYPERVFLVTFDDLVQRTGPTMAALADRLGIAKDDCLYHASIDGLSVGGNSSSCHPGSNPGEIYQPEIMDIDSTVATKAEVLWGQVRQLAVQSEI